MYKDVVSGSQARPLLETGGNKMRTGRILAILVSAALAGSVLPSAAQQPPQRQLVLVTDIHVARGAAAKFEAAHLERNARMAKGSVRFGIPVVRQSEDGEVYRHITTGIGMNYAAFDQRRTQLAQLPAASADAAMNVRDSIVRIDTSIDEIRPDLSYTPATPRIPATEEQFVHEVRLYVKQGMANDVEGIMRKVAELRAQGKIGDRWVTRVQLVGADSPLYTLVFYGRDAADYYAQAARINEQLGEPLRALLGQANAFLRRVENVNFTNRPDLAYTPPGAGGQ